MSTQPLLEQDTTSGAKENIEKYHTNQNIEVALRENYFSLEDIQDDRFKYGSCEDQLRNEVGSAGAITPINRGNVIKGNDSLKFSVNKAY